MVSARWSADGHGGGPVEAIRVRGTKGGLGRRRTVERRTRRRRRRRGSLRGLHVVRPDACAGIRPYRRPLLRHPVKLCVVRGNPYVGSRVPVVIVLIRMETGAPAARRTGGDDDTGSGAVHRDITGSDQGAGGNGEGCRVERVHDDALLGAGPSRRCRYTVRSAGGLTQKGGKPKI